MDLGIQNRVALVAAASKGLGFAAALELAREGARIFLCSRDEARATEAAEKIHAKTGAIVAGIAADVTDNEAIERLVGVALEQAGHIDILVTNAGGPPTSSFAESPNPIDTKLGSLDCSTAMSAPSSLPMTLAVKLRLSSKVMVISLAFSTT